MSYPLLDPRRQRKILEAIKNQFGSKATTICPGFLRQDLALTNSQLTYKFSLQGESASSPLPQKLLLRNDNFAVTHLGFFLVHVDSGATPVISTGNAIPQTYPNAQVFGTNAVISSLNAIYNGTWQLKVDQSIPVDNDTMQVFRRVPQSQKTVSGVALLPAAVTDSDLTQDTEYSGDFSLVPQEPLITLRGNKVIELTVSVPNITNFTPAPGGTVTNYLVAFAKGFLITGVNQGS